MDYTFSFSSFPQCLDFRPTVSELESVGVDPSLVGKLFRKHPQLLKNRMNFGSKVQFLLKLGLEQEDLGRVIYNAPQLLGLREEKMRPTVKFLESIGVKGSSLRKVLKLKPMILAHSVEAKLRPNINFLENLGIDKFDIGKLVTRHPQLLTLSVEKNLEPTVRYFLELGFTRLEVYVSSKIKSAGLQFSLLKHCKAAYGLLVMSSADRSEVCGLKLSLSNSTVPAICPSASRSRSSEHLSEFTQQLG
eukprot:Gb_32120 [translate_table: standard]